MQIHRIHGRDLRDALERAGRLHGTNAVVLGHERVEGGVTVAVTTTGPRETGRRARVAGSGRASALRPRELGAAGAPEWRAPEPAGSSGGTPPAPDALPASRPGSSTPPGLTDVERALARTGTSRPLIEAVTAEVARGDARGAYAIDRAAQLLGARVRIAPSPKVVRGGGRPCVIAFLGERGTGVTTTVTKLAGKLVKRHRRVALVDLLEPDGRADGPAGRRLARDAELLQVPCDAVREAEELARVLERSRASDAVLVDGTGLAGRDVRIVRELRARVPDLRLEVYLTLAANAWRGELDALAADHAAAEPTGLCLTRLDVTRTPAPALEHALETARPLAFLCDGGDVSGHLHRPTPDRIADLFLRGRLA